MAREFKPAPAPPAAGRVALVVSETNRLITERLLNGALDELAGCGVSDDQVDVIWVPGSFELPAAVAAALETNRYGAIVALGCLIRGETDHYYLVSMRAAAGLAELARQHRVGFGFGLLGCDTVEQALRRSGSEHNLGRDAAKAALAMCQLIRHVQADEPTGEYHRREPQPRPEASTLG